MRQEWKKLGLFSFYFILKFLEERLQAQVGSTYARNEPNNSVVSCYHSNSVENAQQWWACAPFRINLGDKGGVQGHSKVTSSCCMLQQRHHDSEMRAVVVFAINDVVSVQKLAPPATNWRDYSAPTTVSSAAGISSSQVQGICIANTKSNSTDGIPIHFWDFAARFFQIEKLWPRKSLVFVKTILILSFTEYGSEHLGETFTTMRRQCRRDKRCCQLWKLENM